jgi:hypothetical protein
VIITFLSQSLNLLPFPNHKFKERLKRDLVFQVVLTPTHLAIVMEYAAGGELFERICKAGRFSEDEVDHLYYM